jgi:hypothetical protein
MKMAGEKITRFNWCIAISLHVFSLQRINHDRARPPSCCLANTFFIDHVDVVCCSPHFYEKERQ